MTEALFMLGVVILVLVLIIYFLAKKQGQIKAELVESQLDVKLKENEILQAEKIINSKIDAGNDAWRDWLLKNK